MDEISYYMQDQHHQKIAIAMRNISLKAGKIADYAQHIIEKNDFQTYKEVKIKNFV